MDACRFIDSAGEPLHMTGSSTPGDRTGDVKSDVRNELRTIAFRLREVQRLRGARVVRENRRLDAADLDPGDDHEF